MKTKIPKLERLRIAQEKFPDFFKAIEEAKFACEALDEELEDLLEKLNDIQEKLDEIEQLRAEVSE